MENQGGSFKFDGVSLAAGFMAASSAYGIAYTIAGTDARVDNFEIVLIVLNTLGAFLTALFQSHKAGPSFPSDNRPKE